MSTITIPSYDVVFRIGGAAHLTACLGVTEAMEIFRRLSRDPAVSGLEIRDGETGDVVKRREARAGGPDRLSVEGHELESGEPDVLVL